MKKESNIYTDTIAVLDRAKAYLKEEYELREDIRKVLSGILMDTSEENPKEVSITLNCSDEVGLCSMELPHIISCWQDPSEGYILFQFEDYINPIDFDYINTEDLITILENLA